jgi:hypothetical protein
MVHPENLLRLSAISGIPLYMEMYVLSCPDLKVN